MSHTAYDGAAERSACDAYPCAQAPPYSVGWAAARVEEEPIRYGAPLTCEMLTPLSERTEKKLQAAPRVADVPAYEAVSEAYDQRVVEGGKKGVGSQDQNVVLPMARDPGVAMN